MELWNKKRGTFKCVICSAPFIHRLEWLEHLKTHKKICRICRTVYYKTSTMFNHYYYLHNIVIARPYCGG